MVYTTHTHTHTLECFPTCLNTESSHWYLFPFFIFTSSPMFSMNICALYLYYIYENLFFIIVVVIFAFLFLKRNFDVSLGITSLDYIKELLMSAIYILCVFQQYFNNFHKIFAYMLSHLFLYVNRFLWIYNSNYYFLFFYLSFAGEQDDFSFLLI